MDNSFNYPSKYRISQYGSLLYNKIESNYYKNRDNIINSIKENNNINTTYEYKENYKIPFVKMIKQNNLLFLNNNEKSRKKSPCFCNCHQYKNYFISQSPFRTEFSKSFVIKDEINNDLLFKMNELNKGLQKFENKLNRIKNEKKLNDSCIQKLEKNYSFLNSNKYFNINTLKEKEKNYFKVNEKNNNNINYDYTKIKDKNSFVDKNIINGEPQIIKFLNK